jgi:ribose 5-phosphate isomerase A
MNAQELKIKAAEAALTYVESGMRLGIGTGSTADAFIRLLAVRVASGLKVTGVPTSERTALMCSQLAIPLSTLEDTPELDLTIDGADEIDARLTLIKGAGGALLREKIVAYASSRMIVIADKTKIVSSLGKCALPIEVNPFGLAATRIGIGKAAERLGLSGSILLRQGQDGPFSTDGGHYIFDASFGLIPDAEALSSALHSVPGVVEHGIFLRLAKLAVVSGNDGVETFSI